MNNIMATCQGDHPITTKVDEQTRVLIDESANEIGVSRSELLRRLLNLYHQSENGELECPACAKTVRIQLDDGTSRLTSRVTPRPESGLMEARPSHLPTIRLRARIPMIPPVRETLSHGLPNWNRSSSGSRTSSNTCERNCAQSVRSSMTTKYLSVDNREALRQAGLR